MLSLTFLRGRLNGAGETARMLDHLERHAQRLPVDELVPVRSAADLAGLDEEELARPAFSRPTKSHTRSNGISRARRSIDIFCAILSPGPVKHWLRRLEARITAGARVTSHTRQHEPGSREDEFALLLRSAGCEISARERMHEKVLIIDDSVLWHGSLNLLAHSGSTDLMMRITDPTSCTRVRHIVERARMDRPARTWRPAPQQTADAASSNGRVSPGDVVDGRLYLNVPFAEKDEAKRLVQARWDPKRKLWNVEETVSRDRVRCWLPGGR